MTELLSIELSYYKEKRSVFFEDLITLYLNHSNQYICVHSFNDEESKVDHVSKSFITLDKVFDFFGDVFSSFTEIVFANYHCIFNPFDTEEIGISSKQENENYYDEYVIEVAGYYSTEKVGDLFQDNIIEKGIIQQWANCVKRYFPKDDPDD